MLQSQIAVNKTALEDHVESTLKSVYFAFPDLTRICKIVDFPRLQPTLKSLADHVVAYCKAATRYYRRHHIFSAAINRARANGRKLLLEDIQVFWRRANDLQRYLAKDTSEFSKRQLAPTQIH